MTHLPARQGEGIGPTGVPLSHTPSEALCFALGYIAAMPVQAEQYGGVCALVEEIMRRSVPIDPNSMSGGAPDAGESLWNRLIAHMPPELARSIQLLYQVHRGQRWARTGRRDGPGVPVRPRIIEGG